MGRTELKQSNRTSRLPSCHQFGPQTTPNSTCLGASSRLLLDNSLEYFLFGLLGGSGGRQEGDMQVRRFAICCNSPLISQYFCVYDKIPS